MKEREREQREKETERKENCIFTGSKLKYL